MEKRTVRDIESRDVAFVCDSQDVAAIKSGLPKSQQVYDSYFALIGDGEYTELYGMFGTVPWHTRQIYQLIP